MDQPETEGLIPGPKSKEMNNSIQLHLQQDLQKGLLDDQNETHEVTIHSQKRHDLKDNASTMTGPIVEHLMTTTQVAEKFDTLIDQAFPMKSQGLTHVQVNELRKVYGFNLLKPAVKEYPLLTFIKKLVGLLNLLLIIAGILSFILYALDSSVQDNLYLGLILVVVSFANAFIDFYQEYKTGALLKSFLKLIPENSTVIREGLQAEIPASELVPGDVIFIRNGAKVPADVRLVFIKGNMKVDNSSLTGEAEPQERALTAGNKKPEEAQNLVFNGTMVVSGDGVGIVIRIGNSTMLGNVANLTVGEAKRESRLTIEIEHFVKKLAFGAFIVAAILFGYGFYLGQSLAMNFGFAIGIFCAFVPQGLPGTVTMLLTIAAKRMVSKNALVKDLQGVETLGSITILCSDKTGTLTQNKMSVVGSWINNQILSAYGVFNEYYEPGSQSMKEFNNVPNLVQILKICSLCSNARFDDGDKNVPSKDRRAYGDATEVGLLRYAAKRVDVYTIPDKHPKVFELPFSSETKWHLTINIMPHRKGRYQIFVKGAPEKVFEMCNLIKIFDKEIPINNKIREEFMKSYEHFASQGNRVIGFANLELDGSEYGEQYIFSKDPINFPTKNLVFLGLISLRDPPKKGVKSAVVALRQAGVQVAMVTGDHPLTAVAIAKQVGIVQGRTKELVAQELNKPVSEVLPSEYDVAVIKGDQLDTLPEHMWNEIFSKEEIVFARTLPHHKLLIVKKAQEYGHIVAVSGDGVNDAPALKKADLGISMNKTGADVSKEAAGMILLDDNFPTVVEGVKEGRLIFVNLKKSIRYTLTHTFPEAIPFILFIIAQIPAMISSFLILLIDLCSEIIPATSLAWEPPEGDLMNYPPRKIVIPPEILEERRKHESHLSCWEGFKHKLSKIFSSNPHEEVLVDNDLLMWSYFQAGLIEFLGCAGAFLLQAYWNGLSISDLRGNNKCFDKMDDSYDTNCHLINQNTNVRFTKDEAINALQSAQTAFYFGIVINQWFTLMVVKNRYSSPIGRFLLKNHISFFGILCNSVLSALISYLPSSHSILSSGNVTIGMVIPIGSGIVLIIYEIFRKILLRRGYFGGIPNKIVPKEGLMRLESFDEGNDGMGSMHVRSRFFSKGNLGTNLRKLSNFLRENPGGSFQEDERIKTNDMPEDLKELANELIVT